jgi:hypothetical protein
MLSALAGCIDGHVGPARRSSCATCATFAQCRQARPRVCHPGASGVICALLRLHRAAPRRSDHIWRVAFCPPFDASGAADYGKLVFLALAGRSSAIAAVLGCHCWDALPPVVAVNVVVLAAEDVMTTAGHDKEPWALVKVEEQHGPHSFRTSRGDDSCPLLLVLTGDASIAMKPDTGLQFAASLLGAIIVAKSVTKRRSTREELLLAPLWSKLVCCAISCCSCRLGPMCSCKMFWLHTRTALSKIQGCLTRVEIFFAESGGCPWQDPNWAWCIFFIRAHCLLYRQWGSRSLCFFFPKWEMPRPHQSMHIAIFIYSSV